MPALPTSSDFSRARQKQRLTSLLLVLQGGNAAFPNPPGFISSLKGLFAGLDAPAKLVPRWDENFRFPPAPKASKQRLSPCTRAVWGPLLYNNFWTKGRENKISAALV